MGGERRESDRDTSSAEWLRRASRLTRKFACGLRRRVPHAGNGEVGRIASGSRALECYAGREAGEVVSLPASI